MYTRRHDPNTESCQAAGRLISFVFHTVSSIYPFPVAERGWGGWVGGVPEVLLLWRAEPDTRGPIPTEAAFIIRPACSNALVITFSVAVSSSGFPKRVSRQRTDSVRIGSGQRGLVPNSCSSNTSKNNFSGRSAAACSSRSFFFLFSFIKLWWSCLMELWRDVPCLPPRASFNSSCHSMGCHRIIFSFHQRSGVIRASVFI